MKGLLRKRLSPIEKSIARRGGDVMSYAEAKVGLKVMRARESLAKTVSGYSYSRRCYEVTQCETQWAYSATRKDAW